MNNNNAALINELLEEQFDFYAECWMNFSSVAFPVPPLVSLKKLGNEICELKIAKAPPVDREDVLLEYVDCFMCLLHALKQDEYTFKEFKKAFKKKFETNLSREWKQGNDGTFSHVKK